MFVYGSLLFWIFFMRKEKKIGGMWRRERKEASGLKHEQLTVLFDPV